jgi:tetratricopeptide (TPR) repeat protein
MLLGAFPVLSQQWKDSIIVAKQAYDKGYFRRAYTAYVEAQRLAPEGIDLSKDIGNSAYRSGDFKVAEQAYKHAIDAEESLDIKVKKIHNHGNVKMQQEDYAGAIESYKKALRLNPSASDTRYNLAMAKRKLKEEEERQQEQEQEGEGEGEQEQEGEQEGDGEGEEGEGSNNEQQNENNSSENSKENNSQQKKSEQKSESDAQEKMSQKRTERLLDELLKQEMETQRKVQGRDSEGKTQEVNSGKRW